jgi:hypothetical protein
MFVIIVLVLLFLSAIPLIGTIRRRESIGDDARRRRYLRSFLYILAMLAVIIIYAVFARFLTELYWFNDLGFEARYLSVFSFRLILFFAAAAVTFLFAYLNFRGHFRITRVKRRGLIALLIAVPLAVLFGIWIQAGWERILFFVNKAGSDVTEPILNLPVTFYLFSLPFYQWVLTRLIVLVSIVLAVIFFSFLSVRKRILSSSEETQLTPRAVLPQLLALSGLIFLFICVNNLLGIPRLLTSTTGIISGVTYVDDKLRIPVLYLVAAMYFVAAVLLFISAVSGRFQEKLFGLDSSKSRALFPMKRAGLVFPVVFFGIIILAKLIVPGIVTAVVVKPNELEVEEPYINNHIAMTQRAYKLTDQNVTQNRFEAGTDISPSILETNRETLDNVRLWDWRALTSNLREQQEIRLYYQFEDVDVDRYTLPSGYTQMMIAARELEKSELEERSQTWVSEKLKYTHGYGIVMLPAHQYQEQGNPELIVKNIPSEVDIPGLEINQPQIYFGERTTDHVYVKTGLREFDYPGEDEQEYTEYQAETGVQISNLFRKLLYAWRFDGHRLLFSRYINKESRILYRRQIMERVARLTPFLMYDKDPYIVLTEQGDLKYILDGYSVESAYPYSELYNGYIQKFRGINYIRNSVKVVLDAYDGSVDFYVIDEEDPLIRTYRNAFPELFRPFSEMPENLQAHIRYPEEYFTIQARQFATYHMEDTDLFYQKEDVWEFSTERYRDDFQTVEPYYVMVDFPGTQGIEFILMLPYTPKNKNVMNAWIAGRSDLPNYGELVVYTIPKGTELLGPRQIEARIDQDTEISRAMTLWGQRGSEVLRGNLLAIPLFNEDKLYILYVEPIYIQAENANLPQIKRVAVADQDRVAWAEMFNDSLSRLTGEEVFGADAAREDDGAAQPAAETGGEEAPPELEAAPGVTAETIARLNTLLQEYSAAAGEGRFEEAGRKLEQMREVLRNSEQPPAE